MSVLTLDNSTSGVGLTLPLQPARPTVGSSRAGLHGFLTELLRDAAGDAQEARRGEITGDDIARALARRKKRDADEGKGNGGDKKRR